MMFLMVGPGELTEALLTTGVQHVVSWEARDIYSHQLQVSLL